MEQGKELGYRPNEKRIKSGKSPQLNQHFRLSKAAKRSLASAPSRAQRAVSLQLAIAAELSSASITHKR
jgi:hypothetical protein